MGKHSPTTLEPGTRPDDPENWKSKATWTSDKRLVPKGAQWISLDDGDNLLYFKDNGVLEDQSAKGWGPRVVFKLGNGQIGVTSKRLLQQLQRYMPVNGLWLCITKKGSGYATVYTVSRPSAEQIETACKEQGLK